MAGAIAEVYFTLDKPRTCIKKYVSYLAPGWEFCSLMKDITLYLFIYLPCIILVLFILEEDTVNPLCKL